jgi:hypothetical protein
MMVKRLLNIPGMLDIVLANIIFRISAGNCSNKRIKDVMNPVFLKNTTRKIIQILASEVTTPANDDTGNILPNIITES